MAAIRTPMPDFTGCVVDDGRYQIIQKLGSGAYGIVYRAVDHHSASLSANGSQLAIKILRKAGLTEREAINVRRELQLHRIMSEHPNVVTMHRAFEDDDYVYIVLDYCPGGDLFQKVCEEGIYFRNDALLKKAFLQIIDAVYACHRKRIFHRDLKPENILCNEDGSEIYLSDFGLATNERISRTFGCGSSFYMSPECIGAETDYIPYSTRYGDIWALGVILVNMITARSPWEKAITEDDCFHDYLLDNNFLREMLPISQGAHDIITQMFTLEPTDRISLPELRMAIENLDTFFMNDAEVTNAPSGCQLAVKEILANLAIKNQKREFENAIEKFDQMKVKDMSIRKAVHLPKQAVSSRDDTPATSPESSPNSSHSVGLTDNDSQSSSVVSSGPVTPANYAIEPLLEVPELSESLGTEWISTIASKVRNALEPAKGPLRVVNEVDSRAVV